MKTIVAGSREINDYQVVRQAIDDSRFLITEVVSGTARGVDRLGEQWARDNGVPVRRMPADWAQHGRSAGAIRNAQMAEYADALIAVWDGRSRGTKNMIDNARRRGMRVHVHRTDELQYQMILELKARVERLEPMVEKLNANNTKIIAKVQDLVTRIGALEAAAAHDIVDITPREDK